MKLPPWRRWLLPMLALLLLAAHLLVGSVLRAHLALSGLVLGVGAFLVMLGHFGVLGSILRHVTGGRTGPGDAG